MTVPFSDAVARSVPSLFIAMHDKGAWCAGITLISCISFASNSIASPPICSVPFCTDGGTCAGVGPGVYSFFFIGYAM